MKEGRNKREEKRGKKKRKGRQRDELGTKRKKKS